MDLVGDTPEKRVPHLPTGNLTFGFECLETCIRCPPCTADTLGDLRGSRHPIKCLDGIDEIGIRVARGISPGFFLSIFPRHSNRFVDITYVGDGLLPISLEGDGKHLYHYTI